MFTQIHTPKKINDVWCARSMHERESDDSLKTLKSCIYKTVYCLHEETKTKRTNQPTHHIVCCCDVM